MNFEYGYYLSYEYQTCFDDGGVGHESYWQKSRTPIAAKNDKEAKKVAKEILVPKHACNGTFCDNKGLRRFPKLEYLETKITVRELSLK